MIDDVTILQLRSQLSDLLFFLSQFHLMCILCRRLLFIRIWSRTKTISEGFGYLSCLLLIFIVVFLCIYWSIIFHKLFIIFILISRQIPLFLTFRYNIQLFAFLILVLCRNRYYLRKLFSYLLFLILMVILIFVFSILCFA